MDAVNRSRCGAERVYADVALIDHPCSPLTPSAIFSDCPLTAIDIASNRIMPAHAGGRVYGSAYTDSVAFCLDPSCLLPCRSYFATFAALTAAYPPASLSFASLRYLQCRGSRSGGRSSSYYWSQDGMWTSSHRRAAAAMAKQRVACRHRRPRRLHHASARLQPLRLSSSRRCRSSSHRMSIRTLWPLTPLASGRRHLLATADSVHVR